MLCRALALLACAGAAVPAISLAAPVGRASARVSAARSCAPLHAHGQRYQVTISRGRVTCRTARSVLRTFLSGHGKRHGPADGPAYKQYWTVRRWRCGTGTGGGACIRHGHNYRTARDYILAQADAP